MLTSPETTLRVLIVDDDEVDRMALERMLKKTEFNTSISEVTNAEAALELIGKSKHDCIFLDYNLPGENGLELTRQIRRQGIRIPLIVLTGQGNEQTAVELMKAGASDYLPKHQLSASAIARRIRSSRRVYQAEIIAEKANSNLREKNALLEKTNYQLEQQQQYIYRQNLKLQEVSRLKSEFLATMSHELRTPLNAIIGFSQILLSNTKGPLADKQHDMIERILANGRNLLELINNVLSFSKLEGGHLELVLREMDLAQLVSSTLQELASLATQKSLQLAIDLAISKPMVINDPTRLRQVLINLLSNAIKFTSTGSVQVSVTDGDTIRHGTTADGNPREICITVTDTGCGISEEDQVYLFDPFHQVDQTDTRHHSGTGLGLAITHSLVNMMNGTISLESQLNQGSTFTVALPRVVVPQYSHVDETVSPE